MGDDEDSEEPYVYSSKPGGSSMYAAVERVLAARPDWTSASSASSFDLLIAERWAIRTPGSAGTGSGARLRACR